MTIVEITGGMLRARTSGHAKIGAGLSPSPALGERCHRPSRVGSNFGARPRRNGSI
jgi:hypothetical protein